MIGIKKNWSDPETYAIPDAPNRGKKYYIIVLFFDYVKEKEKKHEKGCCDTSFFIPRVRIRIFSLRYDADRFYVNNTVALICTG